MGRTNPTYRNDLNDFRDRWQSFKRGMREEDKKYFEEAFEDASKHAYAASYMNPKNPVISIFLSMIIEQNKKIENLKEELKEVKTQA